MGAHKKAGHDFTEEMNGELALEGRVGVQQTDREGPFQGETVSRGGLRERS